MSHLIPFRPLILLLQIIISYGGINWRQIPALLPWITKTVLFEPFRLLEAFYVSIASPKQVQPAPIFVLGFYRSGTTWLQRLLNVDPDYATPTLLQTVLPEVMLTLGRPLAWVINCLARIFKIENPFHRLPFDCHFPGEDDVAINALVYLYDFNRIYQYPSAAHRLLKLSTTSEKKIQEEWCKAHQYFVTKLMLRYPGKRLLLKSPPNTARIALLKKMYPHAQFIFIKRDVLNCVHSNRTLWRINKHYSFEPYSVQDAERIIVEMYKTFHQQYYDQCHALSAGDLVEVGFESLCKNPEGTLDYIYQKLSLSNSDVKKVLRRNLIDKNISFKPVEHIFSDRISRLVQRELAPFANRND